MSDKLTAAEAVEEIKKRLARHDERGDYTKADFVNSVRVILSRVSPQTEPTPESVDADSIRRARDREWCNRLEIQETLRPDDKEVDVHLAFLCRKGGVDVEKVREARKLFWEYLEVTETFVKYDKAMEGMRLLTEALGEKR